MVIRYILGLLLIISLPLVGFSQRGNPLVPYYPWSATFSGGVNMFHNVHDEFSNLEPGVSGTLRLARVVVHGIEVGAELQTGLLKGDNEANSLDSLKYAKNHYVFGTLGARVYPAQFFQTAYDLRVEHRASLGKKLLNRAYVGFGMGVMYNRQLGVDEEYSYNSPINSNLPVNSTPFSEESSGSTIIGTANLGFNIPLSSLNPIHLDMAIWSLNFNAQFNGGMFGNKSIIDGWSKNDDPNSPNPNPNNSFDAFGVYSIGLHVAF